MHSAKPSSRAVASNGVFVSHAIRDQFTISTWLLIGACIQCLLIFLPFPTLYIQALAFSLLAFKMADGLLMTLGLKRNTYLDGTIDHKTTAVFPSASGPKSGKATILLLGFRINHPLGIFAPGAKSMGTFFNSIMSDLEANAPSNGFLGASSYIDATYRTTSSAVMVTLYFKTRDDVYAVAHGQPHRLGWDWWAQFSKTNKHISIFHEVYESPAGGWETVYENCEPLGFGATTHMVVDEKGVKTWESPVFDARKGMLRTHKGRVGLSAGNDNDSYEYKA